MRERERGADANQGARHRGDEMACRKLEDRRAVELRRRAIGR
jgi:hypothetical protein